MSADDISVLSEIGNIMVEVMSMLSQISAGMTIDMSVPCAYNGYARSYNDGSCNGAF